MKRIYWLVILLSGMAYGQGVRFDSIALNPRGQPIQNATVTLCTKAATGTPCSPAATSFTDITTGTGCASGFPVVLPGQSSCQATTDGNGNFGFWLTAGTYKYSISGPSVATPQTYTITLNSENGNFTSATITGALTAGSETVTGALSALSIEGIQMADQFAGADWCAKVNAADTALGSNPGTIWVNRNAISITACATPPTLTNGHNIQFTDNATYTLACDSTTDARQGAGGLTVSSGSYVWLGGATLFCKANSTGYYNAIRVFGVSNVWIYGGILDGNRTNCTAPGGTQWGMGLAVNGSSNVWVYGTVAQNFWGDNFYTDKIQPSGARSSNINFDHVLANNSRRNGASVVDLQGQLTISNSKFLNSNGTAPQTGIDIEPGCPGSACNSIDVVKLINNDYIGNTNRGITVAAPSGSGLVNSVQVIGGKADSNGTEGVSAFGTSLSNMVVDDMTISNNGQCGFYAASPTADGALNVTNNYIIGNATANSTGDCPQLANASFNAAASFSFTNNIVRVGANANKPTIGLALNSNTGTSRIIGNDLAGSASTTSAAQEYNTFTESATDIFYGNRLTAGQQSATKTPVSIAFNANMTIPVNLGDNVIYLLGTLTGNTTLATSGTPTPGQRITIEIVQDATGGRTVAWPGSFGATPAVNLNPNAVTVATFETDVNGTTFTYERASAPNVVSSGTTALNTASITTVTCDGGKAQSAPGTLSTDAVDWSFATAPTTANKYGSFLVVYAVPSANTVTFYTCNPSATTSTPTAMSVNWAVRR